MLDKVTMERCVNKVGRVSYARVLVEVNADKELPDMTKANRVVFWSLRFLSFTNGNPLALQGFWAWI